MLKNIVIVGGGTAGWMSAAYLQAAFRDRISVTVVESKSIDSIGVGEATFSEIHRFFDYVGLAEDDWLPVCNGSYKLGIRFENWRAKGHYFFHPFERLPTLDGVSLAEWWLKAGPGERFDVDCFVLTALCEANRSPKFFDGTLFDTSRDDRDGGQRLQLSEKRQQFPYAYHFDAALLAQYLRKLATGRGVRHIVDDVVHCQQDERGFISHLVTREHGNVAGDLFIDCTGFRGLIINQTLKEPLVSYLDSLPNDRAVALRVPADVERHGIRSYTTATAMDAGWIWTIPLYGRNGVGYVYASDFCTPEQAEADLRAFVGPAAEGLQPNHIRMRIGRNRRSWVNNCVAIGLASTFVEPLESTGIFFIQHGIEQLVNYFPDETWNADLAAQYNDRVARCGDGIREFLTLHYRASARTDTPYWKATKERALPDGMEERLRQWQSNLPHGESVYPHYHGFEPFSYATMLIGLGGVSLRPRPLLDLLDASAAQQRWQAIKAQAERLVRELPSAYEYLSSRRMSNGVGRPSRDELRA